MNGKPSKEPNVIVFFTDQQRWDTTGVHGNPLSLTPNFDRIAASGTHLFNTCTCQPVCGPARSSLQTGLYATNTGCFRNTIPLPQESKTLAHCFSDAGYRTGYIGKWHLGSRDPVPREEQGGYDYWLGANVLEFCSEPYRTIVYDRDEREVFLPGYRVDALTNAAIDYVSSNRDRPFFLFLSFLEPHHQNHLDDYPPPFGYRERYTGRWMPPDLQALTGSAPQHLGGYFGMVKRLDEAFGRLMDSLISMGIDDETIVLFTSDHGCHFKTRNSEYKRSCHESSIRVPTVLYGPGFTGGGRVEELVSLVDLPPTLLDAAGIEVPDHMEGSSMVPLLRSGVPDRRAGVAGDPRSDASEDVFIQISEAQVGRAVRTHRWKYGVDAPDRDGSRDSDAGKYVEQYLYDLYSDPYELVNLAGLESHRRVSDILKERLLNRIEVVEHKRPEIVNAPVRRSSQRTVSEEEAHS